MRSFVDSSSLHSTTAGPQWSSFILEREAKVRTQPKKQKSTLESTHRVQIRNIDNVLQTSNGRFINPTTKTILHEDPDDSC